MADFGNPATRSVYFDIESTTDAFRQTLEIGAVDGEGKTFQTLVSVDSFRHPGFRLGTRIHGISPPMLHGAPSFVCALDRFIEFLEGATTLVAHNGVGFDLRVLSNQAKRHHVDFFERIARAGVVDVLDTHPLFQSLKKTGAVPSGRLGDLYEFYTEGETIDGAHRAMADAMALRRVCSYVDVDLKQKHCVPLESVRLNLV